MGGDRGPRPTPKIIEKIMMPIFCWAVAGDGAPYPTAKVFEMIMISKFLGGGGDRGQCVWGRGG